MALGASVVWEVETTGSDNNGGGFDGVSGTPGTDYTYGAGQAVLSWLAASGTYTNNLASTSASSWLVLTSAARNFVAADVGNVINITAGTNFTAGRYRIVSVAANAATLDRACGATADASAGSGYLGGSLVSPGLACGLTIAGNKSWIKEGTYSITSTTPNISGGTLVLAAGSGTTVWTDIEGYSSTRGDYGTPPLLQAGGSLGACTLIAGASVARIANLNLDGNNRASVEGVDNAFMSIYRIQFRNFIGTVACRTGSAIRCFFTDCTAMYAQIVDGGSTRLCEYVGCGPVRVTTGSLSDSIVRGAVGVGILANSQGAVISNCTIRGSTSYGVDSSAGKMTTIINTHFEANGAKAIYTNGALHVQLVNCSFYNNSGGNYDASGVVVDDSTVAVTDGSPLVSITNMALNATAARGALLRGTGYPGVFPGGLTTGYRDIGATQHGDPTLPAAANVRYGISYNDGLTSGLIEMPNSSAPTGTQDATSDACVVSGKIYGSPQRTGSAAGGGGIWLPQVEQVGL